MVSRTSALLCGVSLWFCILSTKGVKGSRELSLDQMSMGDEFWENLKCGAPDAVYRQQVQMYIRRYVNTFLTYTKLKDHQLSDANRGDFIYASLHFRMRAKDLSTLQRFYEDENQSLPFDDLDDILSDIMYHSMVGKVEAISSWAWETLNRFTPNVTIFQVTYTIIVLCSLFIWYFRGLREMVPFLLITLTLADSIQKYLLRIRNEEIKHYLRMKARVAYPPECDPATQSYWTIIRNLFWEDPCIKYHHDMQGHYSEHISFIECVFSTHLFIFLELPFQALGRAVAAMAGSLSSSGFYGWFIYPAVVTIVLIFVASVFLVLSGFKFKAYSWFGGFEIGDSGGANIRSVTQSPLEAVVNVPAEAASSSAGPQNVVNIILSQKGLRRRKSSRFSCDEKKPADLLTDVPQAAVPLFHEAPLPVQEAEKPLEIKPDIDIPSVKQVECVGKIRMAVQKQIFEGVHIIEETVEWVDADGSGVDSYSEESSLSEMYENAIDAKSSDIDVMAEVKLMRTELQSFCEDDDIPEIK